MTRRRPERREELVTAALVAVRRLGSGASMDEMAAEAGITKPVLYRYFSDREGLIAAVAMRFAEDLVERLQRAVAPVAGEEPEALLRAGIACYVDFIAEDPALYGFLTRQAASDSEAMLAVVDRVAAVIAGIVEERFRGAGLDTRPVGTFAYAVVGMVHLAGAHWARHEGTPRHELVSDLASMAAHGLVGAANSLQRP
jgi:AcrR family transcriptional regulator